MKIEKPAYKRILLKLSGEALMGDDQFGINRDTIVRMVNEVAEVTRLGVEVAVVFFEDIEPRASNAVVFLFDLALAWGIGAAEGAKLAGHHATHASA